MAKGVGRMGDAVAAAGAKMKLGSRRSQLFSRSMQQAGKRAKHATAPLRGLGKGIAGLAASFLGLSAAKSSVDTVIELSKHQKVLAQTYGLSTKAAGEYAAAAKIVHVDDKSLNMGLTMLSRNSVAAVAGTKKQVKAFKELGISQKKLKTTSTDKLLEDTAEALFKMEGGPKKAALSMTLFGRGFQKMQPLIRNGRKGLEEYRGMAVKFGATIKDPEAVKKYIHSQKEMAAATLGLKVMLGEQLIPVFMKGIKWFTKFISDGSKGKGIAGELSTIFRSLAEVLTGLFGWFRKNQRVALLLGATLAAVVAPAFAIGVALLLAYGKFKKFRDIVKQVGARLGEFGTYVDKKIIPMVIRGARNLIKWFTKKLLPTFISVFKDLQKTLQVWGKWGRTFWKKYGSEITAIAKKLWATLKTVFVSRIKAILIVVKAVLKLLRGDWRGALKDLLSAAKQLWKGVVASFKGAGPLLVKAVKGIGKLIWRAFKGLFNMSRRAGKAIGRGLINGIKAIFSGGGGFIKDIGKSLANAVIGLLNKAIPNTLEVPGAPNINIKDNPIPKLFRGGSVREGGQAIVGDGGQPEHLAVRAGRAIVTPLRRVASDIAGGMTPAMAGGYALDVPVQVILDGKIVTETVARRTMNRVARR